MSRAECPHCEKEIQGDELGPKSDDWYYKNNLYHEDTNEVTCPHCKEDFFVTVSLVPEYSTGKTRDDIW